MTAKKTTPYTSPRKAYAELRKLTIKLNAAEDDLAMALWEMHEDTALWNTMTYREMAHAMMVSRQAVQQRVLRLIENGVYVRSTVDYDDPNQLTLDGPFD